MNANAVAVVAALLPTFVAVLATFRYTNRINRARRRRDRDARIWALERELGLDQCEWELTRNGVTLRCQLTSGQHDTDRYHLDPVHGRWRVRPGEAFDLLPPRTNWGYR